MKNILLMILFLLASCSTISIREAEERDLSYKPYVEKFERLLGRKVDDVSISIDYIYDEEDTPMLRTAGVCFRLQKRVILNKYRWDDFPDWYQELLVFHELGHCALGRGHPDHQRKYTIPDFLKRTNCPKSIMESGTTRRVMTESCYRRYYHYYIYELFGNENLQKYLQ